MNGRKFYDSIDRGTFGGFDTGSFLNATTDAGTSEDPDSWSGDDSSECTEESTCDDACTSDTGFTPCRPPGHFDPSE